MPPSLLTVHALQDPDCSQSPKHSSHHLSLPFPRFQCSPAPFCPSAHFTASLEGPYSYSTQGPGKVLKFEVNRWTGTGHHLSSLLSPFLTDFLRTALPSHEQKIRLGSTALSSRSGIWLTNFGFIFRAVWLVILWPEFIQSEWLRTFGLNVGPQCLPSLDNMAAPDDEDYCLGVRGPHSENRSGQTPEKWSQNPANTKNFWIKLYLKPMKKTHKLPFPYRPLE